MNQLLRAPHIVQAQTYVNDEQLQAIKSALCLKCRRCCECMGFYLYKPSADMIEFYSVRGCRIYEEGHGMILFVMDYPCPHLGPDGCNIYATRPKICREFDGTKIPAFKGECAWGKITAKKK